MIGKDHFDHLYRLLTAQLENPQKNKFNRHIVNGGIISMLHDIIIPDEQKAENSDLVGLIKIASGTIEGRKVDVGKIAIGTKNYGVMVNAYGINQCDGCHIENYCEGSYAAAGVFGYPNGVFIGFKVPDSREIHGACNTVVQSWTYKNWQYNGAQEIRESYKGKIRRDRLDFGIGLADKVAEVQDHLHYLDRLQDSRIKDFKAKKPQEKPDLKD